MEGVKNICDDVCNFLHIIFFEADLCYTGSSHADTARFHRRFVSRNGVAVQNDADQIQNPRCDITGKVGSILTLDRFAIQQQHVAVRTLIRNF